MSWLYLFLCIVTCDSVMSIESRVFGAEDLRFDTHKYLVKLKIFFKSAAGLCSGSIIDNYWVLTSAHCFLGEEKYVAVYHQVDEGTQIIAKVYPKNIYLHPEWVVGDNSMSNRAFDLALLKTTRIDFDEHVQPIKLGLVLPRIGQSAIIAGFGESEKDLEPPREGLVLIDWCRYGVSGLLCSEDTVRAGSGDSGGSLTSQGKLIGVTSASCKDAEEPKICVTIYVSVAANIKWLQEILIQ